MTHIRGARPRGAAGLADLVRDALAGRPIDLGDDNPCALSGEAFCISTSDPVPRAGDDGDLVLQAHKKLLPCPARRMIADSLRAARPRWLTRRRSELSSWANLRLSRGM